MPEDRVPLYVRLPRDQAAAIDQLVTASGRHKQQVVSELLSDRLALGRIDLAEDPMPADAEVLTLEEAAALLRLAPAAVRARAEAAELPARRFGDEWRFSRAALMAWLGAGDRPASGPGGPMSRASSPPAAASAPREPGGSPAGLGTARSIGRS